MLWLVTLKHPFTQPETRGTRIAVSDILQKMSHGMTEDDILSEWDYLTPIQIRSCLAYASAKLLARTEAAVRRDSLLIVATPQSGTPS